MDWTMGLFPEFSVTPCDQHSRSVGGDSERPAALKLPGEGVDSLFARHCSRLQRRPTDLFCVEESLRPEGDAGCSLAVLLFQINLLFV